MHSAPRGALFHTERPFRLASPKWKLGPAARARSLSLVMQCVYLAVDACLC